MLFRICRSFDSISQSFSELTVLLSIILNKDKKLVKILRSQAKELPKIIIDIVSTSSETSIVHYRLTLENKVIRVFVVKDIAVSCVKEDEIGQVVSYGSQVLDEFTKILDSEAKVEFLVEEIPLKSLDQSIANLVQKCVEEAEKPYIITWQSKGLYGFKIEKLISDKGGYTYVFKALDNVGETKVVKVFKEEVAVNKDFMDLIRGYIHSIVVSSLSEAEFEEIVKASGYHLGILKELYKYKKYLSTTRALIVMKEKLDEKTYLLYPPVVVEEYATLGDLEMYIQKNGIRGFEEAMYIIMRILGATALAHLIEVPHLDIKPRNILLFEDRQERYGYAPKLTDFSGVLGNTIRGYKIIRLSPGYADPVALAKGVADFDYDAYSISMVLAYILSGDIPKHRLALNILLLQDIYGYPIPMVKIKNEEKSIKEFSKKALDLILQLKNKTLSWHEFAQKINEEVESLDAIYMPWLNEIPKSIATVFKKALTLNLEHRYKNCVEMWIELRDALIKENMEKTLP
jgi:serine/threonine protein kinase